MITVIWVSGEKAFLGLVREVLEQEGDLQVLPLTSGREALHTLSFSSCDAIVADISPGDMDGIALLHAVRETRRIPFILLADAVSADREEDAIAAGVDYFFIKKTDTRSQVHRIAQWIRLAVSRSHAETAIREDEARYHELVENANLLILKLDRDSKITFINEYARNYFGLKKDESPDKQLAETIISAIGTDPVGEMGYFVRDVGTRTDHYTIRETEHVKKNGVRVWISWRNKPLLDQDNTITGVISFGTDMTERRKAEQALFRANTKLNLLNSITRHDILNELTVLGGYIGMTRELSKDKEMLEFIDHEKKATRAIRNMIKFTKDYQDIGLYRPQWQYLKNIVSLLANTVDFGKVILKNDLGRLEVYADPLFEKVVYSLLENAIRHGGPLTFIRLSYHSINGNCVVVCEDNGVGIPYEDKEKIFLREFGKHTGFGLFLSREILSITGFSIQETGVPGNGARFEILIPEGSFRENKTR